MIHEDGNILINLEQMEDDVAVHPHATRGISHAKTRYGTLYCRGMCCSYELPSRLSLNETENIYIPSGFNANSLRIPNRTYNIMASRGNSPSP